MIKTRYFTTLFETVQNKNKSVLPAQEKKNNKWKSITIKTL